MKDEVAAAARWWAESCHRRGLSDRQIQIFRFELEQCLLQRCASVPFLCFTSDPKICFSVEISAMSFYDRK